MSKEKVFIRFITLLLFSSLLFFLDKKGGLDFLKRPIENQVNQFKLLVSGGIKTEETEKGKQELEREVATLKVLNQSLEEENQACRRLLQAPLSPSFKFLPAKFLGLTDNRFLINKGKDQGLKENQVVVLENNFLGRIDQLNPRSAWVETPFSLTFEARTFKTKARGVVKEKSGRLFLTAVLQKETLEEGDLVVTFGQEEIPRDLVIGKIKTIVKEEAEVYQEAELEPLVDYQKLETVFVIL